MNLETLLDSTAAFDESKVRLLEEALSAMYSGQFGGEQFKVVQQVLTELQQHPESWRLVQVILKHAQKDDTRMYALSLLATAVKTRWNVLPDSEREQIPKYLYDLSANLVAGGALSVDGRRCAPLLNKVNETVVLVLKRVWPMNWASFIEDMLATPCASIDPATGALTSCFAPVINNLSIISLFVEDVMDFGEKDIVSRRVQQLRSALLCKFPTIIRFCFQTLQQISQMQLGNQATSFQYMKLKALECATFCLQHTPTEYSLENDLLCTLLTTCYENFDTRAQCVKCISVVLESPATTDMKLQVPPTLPGVMSCLGRHLYLTSPCLVTFGPAAKLNLLRFWTQFMELTSKIPEQTLNRKSLPQELRDFWERIYQDLALCHLSFYKYYYKWLIELPVVDADSGVEDPLHDMLIDGKYPVFDLRVSLMRTTVDRMHMILRHENDEIFKISVEYWLLFSEHLNRLLRDNTQPINPLGLPKSAQWKEIYDAGVGRVRKLIIERMAKPPEVYVVYDEATKCAVKEYQRDTEDASLYISLKQILVNLTVIDPEQTKTLCLAILNQFNRVENGRSDDWDVQLLNRLCWSIGSISGVISQEREVKFLLTVLKLLLSFCQMKSGKDNKALVASMIMYIMGQYPRYLRQNPKLLQVVVDKNWEFMNEKFPGVQDMACETFYKVSQRCADKLCLITMDEAAGATISNLYITKLISEVHTKAANLGSSKLTLLVYSGICMSIAASPNVSSRVELLRLVTSYLNAKWLELMPPIRQAQNADGLSLDLVRTLTEIVGINNCAAEAMADTFAINQLKAILPDLLFVYERFETFITQLVQINKLQFAITKELRNCRRAILNLLHSFLANTKFGEETMGGAPQELDEIMASGQLIPNLKTHVLPNFFSLYRNQQAELRDPEVLSLGEVMIRRWWYPRDADSLLMVDKMLEDLFAPTLEMIKGSYHSYVDIRLNFFKVVNVMLERCFETLTQTNKIQPFLLSLIFGIQHVMPNVGATALKGLQLLVSKIAALSDAQLTAQFVDACGQQLLTELFVVMTDTGHTYGFEEQAAIIHAIVRLIVAKDGTPDAITAWLVQFMNSTYPNLSPQKVQIIASRLANAEAPNDALTVCKDLLIILKEVNVDNQDDL